MKRIPIRRPTPLAAALLAFAPAIHAGDNIITVTTTVDGLDAFDQQCSLREAIWNYNYGLAYSPVVGECPAGNVDGTDVIRLASGATYALTVPGNDIDSGDLDLLDKLLPREVPDLRIETVGGLTSATIQQNVAGQRVIEIFGATVEIDNVVVRGGSGVDQGGGIRNESGRLSLTRCGLIDNQANRGGGLWTGGDGAYASLEDCDVVLNRADIGVFPRGGGIYNYSETDDEASASELRIQDTRLRNNQVANDGFGNGGGLYVRGGKVAVDGSQFASNSALTGGGAVTILGQEVIDDSFLEYFQSVQIANSSIESNTGGAGGGGIWVRRLGSNLEPVRLNNVDFVANSAGISTGGGALVGGLGLPPEGLSLDIQGGRFVDNSSAGGGGALRVGETSILGSRFENNTAQGRGGAILGGGQDGDLTIRNSNFVGNRAVNGGGGAIGIGFDNAASRLDIRNSRLIDNQASGANGDGGAILWHRLEVADSLFEDNQASQRGGAIHAQSSATIERSRILGNSAVFAGGGLYLGTEDADQSILLRSVVANNEAAEGGGIHLLNELVLINSTISGNRAVTGGGLYVPLAADATALYSTITDNAVGRDLYKFGNLLIQASILGTPGEPSCTVSLDNPDVLSFGYNLSADPACGGFNEPTDQPGVDPLLAPLSSSGGTLTHEPLPGSPAIDAIPVGGLCGPLELVDRDQRDAPRPFGAGCDIGAHERGASSPNDAIFADGFESP